MKSDHTNYRDLLNLLADILVLPSEQQEDVQQTEQEIQHEREVDAKEAGSVPRRTEHE